MASSAGVFPITAGVALPARATGFYVTGAGTITGVDGDGVAFTNFAVAANSYHPWEIVSVSAATATGLWGLRQERRG